MKISKWHDEKEAKHKTWTRNEWISVTQKTTDLAKEGCDYTAYQVYTAAFMLAGNEV
jgi:hypothetical protein